MPNAHVAAAATGLPEIDHAAFIFPMARLAALSMSELSSLSQILASVQTLIAASTTMSGPGPAAQMLEDFSGVLISALSDITRVAEAHQPISGKEADWRGWLLLSHAALFSEQLSDIAAKAASAACVERDLVSHH